MFLHNDKKHSICLLRWALIIAGSYLFLFGNEGPGVPASFAFLVALALASNVALYSVPERWIELPAVGVAVVLFDTLWVSAGAWLTGSLSGDFFLVYFLVILVAVVGQHVVVITCTGLVTGAIYAATIALDPSSPPFFATPTHLLRILFFFVVALFYGYWVDRARTERRRGEQARERERVKAEFFANASHELRTPLNVIVGYADLLLDEAACEGREKRHFVEQISASAVRLLTLIDDLLALSAIEAGKLPIRSRKVELPAFLAEVAEKVPALLRDRPVRFRADMDPALGQVETDPMRLQQVLDNLLTNAAKYTPRGEITLTARPIGADATRGVEITVSDTGVGIDEDSQRVIFDEFRRLANPNAGQSEGAGLGLAVCKKLVGLLGGDIEVESKVGEGSTFRVTLPVTRRKPESETRGAAPDPR